MARVDNEHQDALRRIHQAEIAWKREGHGPRTFLLIHTGGMNRTIDHPRWDSSWAVPNEHIIDDLGELELLRVEPSYNKRRSFVLSMEGRKTAERLERGLTDSPPGRETETPAATGPADRAGDFRDVFISHASEDKEAIARPLAVALRERGFSVWFDEYQLVVGSRLSRHIDRGLATSRYGVVVLSPAFLRKPWPQRELAGLVAREMGEDKELILPIWHNVSAEEVREFSPPLADVLAVSTTSGIAIVLDEIARSLARRRSQEAAAGRPLTAAQLRSAGAASGGSRRPLTP